LSQVVEDHSIDITSQKGSTSK